MSDQNDRELVELAAKAAGVRGAWDDQMQRFRLYLDRREWFLGEGWNPQDNDGDSMRLAATLHLQVDIGEYGTVVRRPPSGGVDRIYVEELHKGGQELPATRRTILRAAAIIGKGIK